VATTNEDNLKK